MLLFCYFKMYKSNYSFIFTAVTLAGLLYLPNSLKIWEYQDQGEDEDEMKSGMFRRKRNVRKRDKIN